MDEYVDHYLSSSSWSDMNLAERSSWECGEPDESSGLLGNSFGDFSNDEKKSHLVTITSSVTMDCLAAQDASLVDFGGNPDFLVDGDLLSGGLQLQIDGENCNENSSNGILNGRVKCENVTEYDRALPSVGYFSSSQGTMKLDAQKEVPGICDETYLPYTKMGYVGCDGIKPCESFRDLPTLSQVPERLCSSYDGVYSLSNVMEANTMQGFALQGGNIDNDIDSSFVEMNEVFQLDKLSSSISMKERQDLQSNMLPSFVTMPLITGKTVELPSYLQTASTPSSDCKGTGKPRARARARRGQATDPHSIAERLRREKISERMKNVQELVPNSTKTDKASMLDEILEYVKFLQLQVKVLSMSRLGAAEAVVPLITDGHAEGSNGLSLSASSVGEVEYSPSADQIALEQEVVKLMESNMSTAMQYLQSKGLCLMPIALATAISRAKPHHQELQ